MMAWRMSSRLLGFISVLILACLLTPADFGIVALATSITVSIDGMSQLGVRDALVRLHEERRDYYDTAFSLQVARSLLTATLIACLSLFATNWLADPRLHDVLLVLAVVAALAGFENIGVVTLTRQLDFRAQFILQASPRLLGFLVTTMLACLLRSYWALIAGAIVGRLTGVALTYIICPHRPRFGFAGWRYLLGFSFWSWAGSLALVVWGRSDPFLLGPALGTAMLGLYMIASEIAILPVTELLEPVSVALFPGFALARRNGTSPITMGFSVGAALALLTIPFSIGVSACSGYLVASLLGARWDAAQPLISVLAWLCIFSPFSYVASSVLSAEGYVRRVFSSNAIAAAVKVGAILIVRGTHDLIAISMTSVAVVAVESSIFIWQLRAAGNAELRQFAMTLARAAVSGALTCAVLSVLPGTWQTVTIGRIPALFIGGLIGAATFLIFFCCQASLWVLAGRPPGAEFRLTNLIAESARITATRSRFPWVRLSK